MNRALAAQAADDFEAALAKLRRSLDAAEEAAAPAPALTPAAPAPAGVKSLKDSAAFFDAMRGTKWLGPALSQQEVDGLTADLNACGAANFPVSWTAYVIATDYHETAGTMTPIREYGRGAGRPYGKPGPHGGQVAYGRGRVQLTWAENYAKADKELGLNGRLLANYDLALDPTIASEVMIRGMEEGWFNGSGKGLGAYLPEIATREQFKAARRTVNVQDKADMIAGYALDVQAALQKGNWS